MSTSSPIAAGEPEILAGRRAFGTAQALLAGTPFGIAQSLNVGWYDSSLHPESGSFALVRDGGGFDSWVGEIVLVSVPNGVQARTAFAYVIEPAKLPGDTDIAVCRRVYLALCRLSLSPVAGSIVAVENA